LEGTIAFPFRTRAFPCWTHSLLYRARSSQPGYELIFATTARQATLYTSIAKSIDPELSQFADLCGIHLHITTVFLVALAPLNPLRK
jgi:hypothetical protein